MSRVVFDIETLAFPFESFDEIQRDYLLKFAETPEKREAEIQKLSLSPLTSRIIAIGMWNPDSAAGKVFYQAAGKEEFRSDDGRVEFQSGGEDDVLRSFWSAIQRYDQFITFNGRSFDCPFIMLRSAILGVRPSRNLVPYRYDSKVHCDLLDQLTYYGSVRKFSLDFYCKAFGIESPKAGGITGADLEPLFRAGKYREIARYCAGDIQATAELFRRWDEFLNVRD